MSTSRLADSRIRAAASQVVGLDVRGPVSRALGQIPVPLAEPVGETDTAPETAPAEAASRPRATVARRVVKPFAEAPWPTQKAKADPRAALSGLTADERRVHRILLDTLVIQSEHGYGNGTGVMGLSYAEKQYLTVLDLAFIDAEIAKMDGGADWSSPTTRWSIGLGLGSLGLIAAGAAIAGKPEAALSFGLTAFLFALFLGVAAAFAGSSPSKASTPRRRIYAALRELALLVNDAPVSDALSQADAVIDRLAAADDGPRLRLDDSPTATASGTAPRTRARS